MPPPLKAHSNLNSDTTNSDECRSFSSAKDSHGQGWVQVCRNTGVVWSGGAGISLELAGGVLLMLGAFVLFFSGIPREPFHPILT